MDVRAIGKMPAVIQFHLRKMRRMETFGKYKRR
jgi:hypothetical protein